MTDAYSLQLASSGKLKLRATARLAEGSSEAVFEACVLLHDAARIEQKAVELLDSCPSVTRLRAYVEACWCLVEGKDPPRAAGAWGKVLSEKRFVDAPTASQLLSRLTPRFEKSRLDFAQLIRRSPTLCTLRDLRAFDTALPTQRSSALSELDILLKAYPGAALFWWAKYRLTQSAGKKGPAWDALRRARQLDPENVP